MNEKLRQAVQAVKAGEKQAGFQMVQEIIKEQPRNADAWYVMAGLVPQDQREKCLRQVLKINPTHVQARKALHKLEDRPPVEPVAEDAVPRQEPLDKQPEGAPVEPEEDPAAETWPGASSYGAPPAPAPQEPEAADPEPGPEAADVPGKPSQPEPEEAPTGAEEPPQAAAPEERPSPTRKSSALPSPAKLKLPRGWKHTARSKTRVTLITENEVIKAEADEDQPVDLKPPLAGEPLAGTELLNKLIIPLQAIEKVRQTMSSVRIFYEEEGQEVSVLLDLEDSEAAEQVMVVLRILLGEDYQATAEPMNPLTALGLSVLYIGIASGITAFGLWGAVEIKAGNVDPRGSAFSRTIINILDLLGPVGVGIIGGVLILIAVLISGVLLLNPPTVTILARKGTEDG